MFIGTINDKSILITDDKTKYAYINLDYPQFDWNADFSNLNWISHKNILRELKIPVISPGKIICVGKNYEAHAKEMSSQVPQEPLLFQKPTSSLLGNFGQIILPEMSKNVEHETELVIIIKKSGKNISKEKASEYIFGYTIGLDITARDLQRSDMTWFRAKSFDTFAPVGPYIVSPTSINLDNCSITLHINGELRQKGNTVDMIFKVNEIIAYISQIVKLYPGDLIFTGTPEGVGSIHSGDHLQGQFSNFDPLDVSVR